MSGKKENEKGLLVYIPIDLFRNFQEAVRRDRLSQKEAIMSLITRYLHGDIDLLEQYRLEGEDETQQGKTIGYLDNIDQYRNQLQEEIKQQVLDSIEQVISLESLEQYKTQTNNAIASLTQQVQEQDQAIARINQSLQGLSCSLPISNSNDVVMTSNDSNAVTAIQDTTTDVTQDNNEAIITSNDSKGSNELANNNNQGEGKVESDSFPSPDTAAVTDGYSQDTTSTSQNEWETPKQAEERLGLNKNTINPIISKKIGHQSNGTIKFPRLELAFLVTRKLRKGKGKVYVIPGSTWVKQIELF
jgi:transcriptional regulator with PAS, ATPase and Fis domain